MVLRAADLRRPHAVADRRSPARPARRWPARRRSSGYFAFCTAARWRSSTAAARRRRRGLSEESAAIGIGAGARARRAASCSSSLYHGVLGGLERAAVRQLPRHHRRPGAAARRVPRWRRSSVLAASAGRCCSPRSTPSVALAARRARARALATGFLLLLGAGGGRDQPDHGRAAGVRAAGRAARRPRSCVTPRPARSLAADGRRSALVVTWLGPGDRLLLDLPGRASTSPSLSRSARATRGAARARGARTRRRSADARPRVHAQRVPRRHVHRAGLRAGRLVRGAAQRRCSRATRSATWPSPARSRRPRRARRARRPVRRDASLVALGDGRRSGERARRRRRGDRHRVRVGARPRRACSWRSSPSARAAAATGRPACACCSARSSGSAPATRGWRR